MFEMHYPWWEFIIRAVAVFIVVFLLFRLIGKKQLGEMGPFDFVLLLIVSESVSGALIGKDDSLFGGWISATTLIGLSYLIDLLVFRSRRIERFVEGEPQLIIKDGHAIREVLNRAKITSRELKTALREKDIAEISEVKFAILETNGNITAIKY
jgi:uncharacterized membrane protein YcaP (DUF421 family)